jgi:hypothetical protein
MIIALIRARQYGLTFFSIIIIVGLVILCAFNPILIFHKLITISQGFKAVFSDFHSILQLIHIIFVTFPSPFHA